MSSWEEQHACTWGSCAHGLWTPYEVEGVAMRTAAGRCCGVRRVRRWLPSGAHETAYGVECTPGVQ